MRKTNMLKITKLNNLIFQMVFVHLLASVCLATSDQGNSGYKFLGFSPEGTQIAYLKFVEHYGRFNNLEGNEYHREYIGIYSYDLQSGEEKKRSAEFSFDFPGFSAFTWIDDTLEPEKASPVENAFSVSEFGKIRYKEELLYNFDNLTQLISEPFLFKDYDLVLLHLKLTFRGEYREVLFMYRISTNEKILRVSPDPTAKLSEDP